MPYVAFLLRMQAAARRQLTLIGAIRIAQSDHPDPQLDALQRRMGEAVQPVFALVQSDG